MASKNNYWFKAHGIGYGWSPATLEGWLTLLGYILVLLVAIYEGYKDYSTPFIFLKSIAPTVGFATLVLLFIAYKKGEPQNWPLW